MNDKQWYVYKLQWLDGVTIGLRREDVKQSGAVDIYGPCSYQEAQQYLDDVRAVVIKPITLSGTDTDNE